MLKLTPNQKFKIRQIQERSFADYCRRCGYDEHEHSEFLLSLIRTKMAGVLQNIGIALKDIQDDNVRLSIEAMLKADNFLDARQAELEGRRKGYAKILTNVADRLPISIEYTTTLRDRIGLVKPEAGFPTSIRELVEAIPLIASWDIEFNAFAANALAVDGLPSVCIYETLLTTCDAFVDCVAPIVIDFGSKARMRPVSDCGVMGSQTKFMERLHSCLRLLLGEANYAFASEREIERQTRNTMTIINEGSVQTVWFHEVGHLLLGHLEQPESHTIEFEADRFALSVIASDNANTPLALWCALGSVTTFVLIDLIETIKKRPESATHPLARRRIEAALEFWQERDPLIGKAARAFLPAIAAACNPTLQNYWNTSLRD